MTAPGPVAVAGQHGDEELTEGQQRRLGQDPQQAEPRVALQHGPQLVAPLQRLHGHGVATGGLARHRQRLQPAGDRLAVAHPRVRSHHDARARDLAAPREVEVLPHGDDPGVEALELGEEIGPDQNAAARGHEDVAYGVVLPVVDLALDDAIHHGARLVAAHPDVEEDAGVVPVHELRRDHPGVGPERLLHQLVHRVGVEGDIVVQEQEEGRSLHHAERLVGRRRVAGPARQVPHEGVGEDAGHPLGHLAFVLPGRQDEDRHLLVVLEPPATKVPLRARSRVPFVTTTATTAGTWASIRGPRLSGPASTPSGTKHASSACYCLTDVILLYTNAVACRRLLCPERRSEPTRQEASHA